jgi:MFS family permease
MSATDTSSGEPLDVSPRSVVLAVVVSTFFVGFGGGVIFPILPNLGEVLGISAFMVGVILAANRWTRLVANAPAGVLVDRVGTRKPFIAGLAIEGVATFGYVVALLASHPAVWFLPDAPEAWFVLARILWGIGSALVFATAYTITADVSDTGSRGTSMGIVRAGITFGFPAGLVLGGLVSETYGNAEAFVLAAAFAGLASIIAYFVVPETHVEEHDSSVKPWDLELTLPALTVGLVNFGLYFAYIGVLFSTLVLYLQAESLTISTTVLGYGFEYGEQGTSGLLMAVTVLAGAVFTILGGALSDSVGARMPVLVRRRRLRADRGGTGRDRRPADRAARRPHGRRPDGAGNGNEQRPRRRRRRPRAADRATVRRDARLRADVRRQRGDPPRRRGRADSRRLHAYGSAEPDRRRVRDLGTTTPARRSPAPGSRRDENGFA